MKLVSLFVSACLVAALAAAAEAAPFTTHLDLDGVAAELAARDGQVAGAQQEAVDAAQKALGKKAGDASDDLKALSSAAKVLDRAFPSDAALGAALDGALAGLRGLVAAERDDLAAAIALLPDSKQKTKGTAGLPAIDALIAAADAQADRSKKAKFLGAAEKKVYAVRKASVGGGAGGYLFAVVDGKLFAAKLLQGDAVDMRPLVEGHTLSLLGYGHGKSLFGGESIVVTILALAGPGVYPFNPPPHSGNSASYTKGTTGLPGARYCSENEGASGAITIAEFDPAAQIVAGTFSFACAGAQPTSVQSGRFRLTRFQSRQ